MTNDEYLVKEAAKRIAEAQRAIDRAWELRRLIEDPLVGSGVEEKIINLGQPSEAAGG